MSRLSLAADSSAFPFSPAVPPPNLAGVLLLASFLAHIPRGNAFRSGRIKKPDGLSSGLEGDSTTPASCSHRAPRWGPLCWGEKPPLHGLQPP